MSGKGITPQKAREIRSKKGLAETKLLKMRMKKGWSQTELAERTGVGIRAIRAYESKSRDIDGAKLDTLCKLCISLECAIEDILEDESVIEKYKAVKNSPQ